MSLHRLAESVGLAQVYQDFWGHDVQAPDAALRCALKAIGLPADTDAQIERSLNSLSTEELAPVVVLTQNKLSASLPVPEKLKGTHWVLTLEQGKELAIHLEVNQKNHSIHFPDDLPLGYHHLSAHDGESMLATCSVIVTPEKCWQPPCLEQQRWGACVQLYALRSKRNWGIGDFTDLHFLVSFLAKKGAAFVGLNPLHALFSHCPEMASPYSPSTRNALNPLYLDVENVSNFKDCEAARTLVADPYFQKEIQSLRDGEWVDYAGVSSVKYQVLELLWAHFQTEHRIKNTPFGRCFENYIERANKALQAHALFEALQAHFFQQDSRVWGWPAWPLAYQNPASPAVADFAKKNADRIDFYLWLQWQTDLQFQAVHESAKSLEMEIGLYRDLAVGVNEGGSETWQLRAAYALQVHVGAPPDPLSAQGQDWGLPPLNPLYLRRSRYQPFIDTLRANMRHAGALRLDHVMALMRLFWVTPDGGVYMAYPLDDLLGILALESHRHQCLVIGEDLGNVAPTMRQAMQAYDVLSYRPLMFERLADGRFKPPSAWQACALAVVGTHDLPTLRGFWLGDDLTLLKDLGVYPDEAARSKHALSRAQERENLLLALDQENILPPGATRDPRSLPDCEPALVNAVYAYLAKTRSRFLGVQLEDVTQQILQVNVPGTTENQFPNWRRKLPIEIESLTTDPRVSSLIDVLHRYRSPNVSDVYDVSDKHEASISMPLSTYRLQFNANMTFDKATRQVIPYLNALGISHLYASPYLCARKGSTHGYDIVDHNTLNPEIGDEAAFDRFCSALHQSGMQQMLDTVPNHMAVLEAENPWWRDVLENGPASAYADVFDISWCSSLVPEMAQCVLLPVLGDHYGKVLEAGELTLHFHPNKGEFNLHYWQHVFPVNPCDYARILSVLPVPANFSDQKTDKKTLANGVQLYPEVHTWIKNTLKIWNGLKGKPHSFDALDELIQRQAYRLAYWRVASDDINYRRFFDVNALAGLCMENQKVFDLTHRRVLEWVRDGKVTALRIDHPDGLADPQQYFEKLQMNGVKYIVVEKILEAQEQLPASWPVQGETGYRFASRASAVFVDHRNESDFNRIYTEFSDQTQSLEDIVFDAKLHVIDHLFSSELNGLTETLYKINQRDRCTRDFTRNALRRALRWVAASFSVYRTYSRPGTSAVSATDIFVIDTAVKQAKQRSPAADHAAIDRLREVLLNPAMPVHQSLKDHSEEVKKFITRWQQFTAPVMAKATEDTAFYRFHRLISLNDVGGDPGQFGIAIESWHQAQMQEKKSTGLLATSTHDTKRSEDVRARLNVLSEMPREWEAALQRWQSMNNAHRTLVNGESFPSRNDEYLLYQTLIGVWPFSEPQHDQRHSLRERVQAFMQKALREAKVHTSWLYPNPVYERAMATFIDALFEDKKINPFLSDFQVFVERMAPFGAYNSLGLITLKLTAPGVPDIYQGCEQWNFSLVDPDNRRPVDFEKLAHDLAILQTLYRPDDPLLTHDAIEQMLENLADGKIKHFITWRLLQLRRRLQDVFKKGDYMPLTISDENGDVSNLNQHVIAFARMHAQETVIVVVSRLLYSLLKNRVTSESHIAVTDAALWRSGYLNLDLKIAQKMIWRDAITGQHLTPGVSPAQTQRQTQTLALSDIFRLLPVAVLERVAAS